MLEDAVIINAALNIGLIEERLEPLREAKTDWSCYAGLALGLSVAVAYWL